MSKKCVNCNRYWSDHSKIQVCTYCNRPLLEIDDFNSESEVIEKKIFIKIIVWLCICIICILVSLCRNYRPEIDMGGGMCFKAMPGGEFLCDDEEYDIRIKRVAGTDGTQFFVTENRNEYGVAISEGKTEDGQACLYADFSDGDQIVYEYSNIYYPNKDSIDENELDRYRIGAALSLIYQKKYEHTGSGFNAFWGCFFYFVGLILYAVSLEKQAKKGKPIKQEEPNKSSWRMWKIVGIVLMILEIIRMLISVS